ncbi:putative disease resistance protein [Vitis vinifera]|uniref:Putative disease resistance protein n=1 Tax=Vitis vinifera TaxID=29760 RepID=A0A438CMS5_VITVI|nr:putative disease resistance protein [Vitis vinifera]
MPDHIGQLRNLQELSRFIVGQTSGRRIGELRGLSEIRGRLHISELQNVVCGMDALEANLKDKKYVDDLVLEWKSNSDVLQNGIDIVNNLQPHENVKRLTVDSYGGTRFPDCKALHIPGNSRFEKMRQWKEWVSFRGGEGGAFPHLQVLCIRHCPNLTGELPCELPSLTTLQICGCQQLVASVPRVSAIRELKILNCGQVLFGSPPYDFTHLQTSGIEISNISQWKELPQGLRGLTILKCVSAECCLPTSLKSLRITTCRRLHFLLPEFLKCDHPLLERLRIEGGYCRSISAFSFGVFPKLTRLEIYGIEGLESLSISISEGSLPALDILLIHTCYDLVSIEFPTFELTRYEIIHCKKLKSLMCSLGSFEKLILRDCPLLLFPVGGSVFSINSLRIDNCDKLTPQVEWGLQGLASLAQVSIRGGCQDLVSFPKEGLLPSTLTSLVIESLPNLKSLDGKGLQLLTSLKKLCINDCQNLQSLPKEGLPTSISFLKISNCPLLKNRCQFWKGEDWQHIAHIPRIVVDDQVL